MTAQHEIDPNKQVQVPLFELVVGINSEGSLAIESNTTSYIEALSPDRKEEFRTMVLEAGAAFARSIAASLSGSIGPEGVEIFGKAASENGSPYQRFREELIAEKENASDNQS